MTSRRTSEADRVHTDLGACDQALHELVSAIIAHDAVAAPVDGQARPLRVTWFEDVDLARATFDDLTGHPVRHALRQGVRRIGREIHRLGGTGTMLDSLERVAGMVPAQASRRAAIMDAAFNGVGSGIDRWWS